MAETNESGIKGAWKRDFYKQVSNELKITQQGDKIPATTETDKVGIHDFPRWEVLNVAFDKNKPTQSVTLYGNSALMPLQISLANAVYEMLSWQESPTNYEGNNLTSRKGYPLVTFFFEEDRPQNVPSKDFVPVQGTISFRLMEYLEYQNNLGKTLLTWEKIEKLAKDIYNEFQKPNNQRGLLWKKGKISHNYNDWDSGYGLKILCQAEGEGEAIAKKILGLVGHSYDASRVSFSVPKDRNDYKDGRQDTRILGEVQKAARYRPEATVRFKNAKLFLSKRKGPITLVSRGVLSQFPQ